MHIPMFKLEHFLIKSNKTFCEYQMINCCLMNKCDSKLIRKKQEKKK